MKMRLFVLSAAILAGALAAAGCGGPTGAGSAKSDSQAAKSGPFTIGYSDFFVGNSWQAENVQLFNDACKQYGKTIIKSCFVENADSSTSQQIAQLQGMINEHVSAILLDANSSTGLNGVVQRALNAGIPVINFDSIITGQATSKINTDQSQWGTITGQWLVKQLHGKGNIVVLNGLAGNPTNNLRYEGAEQVFKATPGIHILQTVYAQWDQATAQSMMAPVLNAYPKIDGVWSQGGAMTAGAIIDFQKTGRKLVPMTGEAYNVFLKQWIDNKSSGFTSISPGQPNYLVTLSLSAAIRALRGEHVPAAVNVPLPVITDQTVQNYYRPDEPPSYWVLDKLPQAQVNQLLGGSEGQ